MAGFQHNSWIREYNVYQSIWDAVIGDDLTCIGKDLNIAMTLMIYIMSA